MSPDAAGSRDAMPETVPRAPAETRAALEGLADYAVRLHSMLGDRHIAGSAVPIVSAWVTRPAEPDRRQPHPSPFDEML